MFHIRRLELCKVNVKIYERKTKGECEGKDHRWVESTWFDGYKVPEETLERVYKLRGEKRDWVVGRRDAELPDKAWVALKTGRRKAQKMRD
jgi:hypothetical protein